MFTAENFRKIFDSENRKGIDLGKKFFPEVADASLKIKDKVSELRVLRSNKNNYSPESFLQEEKVILHKIKEIKATKSSIVDEELEKICHIVSNPNFKITLEKKDGPHGKPIYILDGTAETYFVGKQLQNNVYSLYKVKQASRHDLASQIQKTLQNKFPLEIVRTDIASFYESVNKDKLIKKLDEDQLLSSASKRIIKQILNSYSLLSGSNNGLPRGVGVSAYLAELYMRSVDYDIGATPGLILYCRYVDDIVAIFARPNTGASIPSYEDLIIDVISKNQLNHNLTKTKQIITTDTPDYAFEYLGYEYVVDGGKLNLFPSKAKLTKIEKRIAAAFDAYDTRFPINPRIAFRDLVSRVKFLTGNTRLVNSKSSATTGIFYNNPLVTTTSSFETLDKALKIRTNSIKRKVLRDRLKKFSFVNGFTERHFHNFSSQELENIVKVWKYV